MVHEKYNIDLLITLSVPILLASGVLVRDEHYKELINVHKSNELQLWIVGPEDN
jgi:hypothetical protein